MTCAQHLTIRVPREPPATPVSKPEARHRVLASPATIFNNLLNPSTRRLAYQQLGANPNDFDPSEHVDDVRLLMVNLDDDEELEAILIYTIRMHVTRAIVLDKGSDGWWQIGEFDAWWHWTPKYAEQLISLEEIVWPGRKDIVVRVTSGGTDVVRTDLSVYRVYRGKLYRVFTVAEALEAGLGRGGMTLSFKTRVRWVGPQSWLAARRRPAGQI